MNGVEVLPLVWLIVLCIFDSKKNFSLKVFYCEALKNLTLKNNLFRVGCTTVDSDCPIFGQLKKNIEEFDKYCPSIIEEHEKQNPNSFWVSIKRLCFRYQQAAFWEVIFIQFFIGYLHADSQYPRYPMNYLGITSNLVAVFYLILTALIFLFPYLLYTYFEQEPISWYVDKKRRFAILILILCFMLTV